MEQHDKNIKLLFKRCSACGTEWITREDFLKDPELKMTGYQAHFKELTEGMFLFNHSCQATLVIRPGDFTDMYTGPVFKQRATGTKKCPSYCVREHDLSTCPIQCECAYVRDVIQIVKNYF